MTYKEALQRMRILQRLPDTEIAHIDADKILCDYLVSLGATELVEEWDKIYKWYA